MRVRFLAAAVACLCLIPLPRDAHAAACDGFVDVDPANTTYCAAVTFMKDRGITLGCDATHYCPNDYVTRLQMGLFMKRLGGVIAPTPFQVVDSIGASTIIGVTSNVLCKLDVLAAPYPRLAELTGTYYGSASAPYIEISLQGRASGGTAFGFTPYVPYLPVFESGTITQSATYPLEPLKAYSFWINLRNVLSPDVTLTGSNCLMRALVFNSDA